MTSSKIMVYHQEALVAMHLRCDWFILYIHIDLLDIHTQARGISSTVKMRLNDAKQACME